MSYRAIGHVMVPKQLPSAMLLLVEFFHLWDIVFQLKRQTHGNAFATPSPCTGIEYLSKDNMLHGIF